MRRRNIKGIVTTKTKGFYYVECDDLIHECRLRGLIKRNENKENCIVGDNVEISPENVITKVYTRKNMLERPLVSNIDLLFIQFAAKDPDIDHEKLNILILNSYYYNIKPIIIINKIDLVSDEEKLKIEEGLKYLSKIDLEYYFISTKKDIGIDLLREKVKDKISAFGGPSGVGKSSVINMLQDEKIMETGETSKKLKKGKHTTKEIRLLKLQNGGYVIDTPGFSSIELPDIPDEKKLLSLFPEFGSDNAIKCKFNNCHHINEPGCYVKEMVEKGNISLERYMFYKKIYEKLKNERWNKYDR